MTELNLQKLWRDKRLPFHLFQLTDGSPIEILKTGQWNSAGSGPDFQFAEIKYDHLKWIGSIEFHLKSSDWYRHQHHIDESYNNVILHVVHQHDRPVFVNGQILPTLELKHYLKGEFELPSVQYWQKQPGFHCKKRLKNLSNEFQQMQHFALKERLNRKLTAAKLSASTNESIYQFISIAFGTKSNALSFDLLAHQIPLHTLITKSEFEIRTIIASNIQGWKGKNLSMNKSLIARVDSWMIFIKWYFIDQKNDIDLVLKNIATGFRKAGIKSHLLKNNIRINALIYLAMQAERQKGNGNSGILKAMQSLISIPSENNRVVRNWDKIGIGAKNALESQANLEIYQQFCENNKCMQCCVGQQMLKS